MPNNPMILISPLDEIPGMLAVSYAEMSDPGGHCPVIWDFFELGY